MSVAPARKPAKTTREVRSLEHLAASASTARTLNLISVWQKHGRRDEYRDKPFFKNPVLNRSIIVKHRLRANERDIYEDRDRTSGTKIILPIDITDMRLGARSFFVGQRGYDEVMEELSGESDGSTQRDKALLALLDTLPSMDPFLMRERLRKDGFAPARCYFDLTDADSARMFQFVKQEVTPLIGMSFEADDPRLAEKTSKMALKILANASDADLEPFRRGLGMDKAAFEEGVFCWKGFIYYKWSLVDVLPRIRPVSAEIASVKPRGPMHEDERAYISGMQQRMSRAIGQACETVRNTLKVYDDAYTDLTSNGQPQAFRQFLLRAPGLFHEIGERLGAVQHIVSFWRFRFPEGEKQVINADELVDLLSDFENSLGGARVETVPIF